MKKVLIIFISCVVLTSCGFKEDWMGFYYPNANDLSEVEIQSGFSSIDECRNWVDSVAIYGSNYDYECGKNCKYESFGDYYVCKVTEQ